MDDNKKKLIIGGLFLAVGGGLLYLFTRKRSKVSLNHWLEEYLEEVSLRFKTFKANETPSLELIAYALNLRQEIEDYLYESENLVLEKRRQGLIGDKEYEELVDETIRLREKYSEQATRLVEAKLGVSINNLRDTLNLADKEKIVTLMWESKKHYPLLPQRPRDKVKEAFLSYTRACVSHDKLAIKNMEAAKFNHNYKRVAHDSLVLQKFLTRDLTIRDYGINPKYFHQLLVAHSLLNDEEVKASRAELLNLTVVRPE